MGKKSTQPKWSDVKRQLRGKKPAELVALVRDLFDVSPENRKFLAARFLHDDRGPEVREPYRKRIHAAFYARKGLPQERLALGDARKSVREYRKATGDVEGTLEMLVFVEAGTDFALEFGDIDEPFDDSLCSALDEARKLRDGEGRALHPGFRDRLRKLARRAGGLGWGYGDFLTDVVAELEDKARRSR